jgi:hypothetical protein
MTTAEIFLPWPDRRLSPNGRQHWAQIAHAKRAAKRTAYYAALEAGIGKIDADSLSVRLIFFPPDNRRRDIDNLLSSQKAALDGVAQAIGIDDSRWRIALELRSPIERAGMVKVELEWNERRGEAAA